MLQNRLIITKKSKRNEIYEKSKNKYKNYNIIKKSLLSR